MAGTATCSGWSQIDNKLRLNIGETIEGRWKVVSKLGEGAFGAVYEAVDTRKQFKEHLALKLESNTARDQVLKIEIAVMSVLQKSPHITRLYSGGRNDRFNYVLMSLLGPSIDSLRHSIQSKSFTMSTSIRVFHDCLKAIQHVHEAGYLHRDIKPSNFAIGCTPETSRTLYLFDFGLARGYMMKNKQLRPPRRIVGFRGTLRYCSINCHKSKELGRHDDIISLLYMFVEMVKGELPWKHLVDVDQVYKNKLDTYRTLCQRMPSSVSNIQNYLYSLKYMDEPRYSQIENFSLELIRTNKYYLQPYDWEGKQSATWNIYAPANSASKYLYMKIK